MRKLALAICCGSLFFLSFAVLSQIPAPGIDPSAKAVVSSTLPVTLPNGELWYGLTNPPPDTKFRRDHPRILMTPETIYQLRDKLAHPEYSSAAHELRQSKNSTDLAFAYAVWGDEVKGRRAIESLLNWSQAKWGAMQDHTVMLQGALMYDWLYNLMTPQERKLAQELIVSKLYDGLPTSEYYWSADWAGGGCWKIVTALALDNDWALQEQARLLDPAYPRTKVYGGMLDALTSNSLQNGGGWHVGTQTLSYTGYEGSFFSVGGPVVLKAWETATGQPMFARTTYFEKSPFDILAARRFMQPGIDTGGLMGLENCTGVNSPESAALARWLLDNDSVGILDGRGKALRIAMGDLRIPAKSPEELGVPLHGWLDGANCVYVRTGWKVEDTAFLFFARHWDRGRYEQESAQLAISKNGVPILPLSTEAKGVAHTAFTSLRVFSPGGETRQGNSYWKELRGANSRAHFPDDVTDPNKPYHRPETLTHYSERNGVVTATTRFEKLLKVATPVAQRTVVINPHDETVQINDYVELSRGLNTEIWFGLHEQPKITGNMIENAQLLIDVQSSFEQIVWDPAERETSHRGMMWIVGTLKISPTVTDGKVDSSIRLSVK